MRRSRWAAGLAIILAVAGVTAVVPAPAWAVPGLVVVSARSAQTGQELSKSVSATCPSNTRVLGGAADIVGGGNGVHLRWMQPVPGSPDSYFVVAGADSLGYVGSWYVTAWAVCAPAPRGWEVVEGLSFSGAGDTDLTADAVCPAGKKAIGNGGGVGAGHDYVLDDVAPTSDLQRTYAEIMHDGTRKPPDETFLAYAFAVCVNPLPGQQMVSAHTALANGDKTTSVTCPGGTRVHSAGGGIAGAYGQAHFDRIGLSGAAGTGAVDVDARQDLDGTTAKWSAWAFAICAS
jgi:hypothetical protein